MLTGLMILGALLLVLIPLAAAGLIVWYGLNNPETGAGKWVYRWWPFGKPQVVLEREQAKEQQVREELKEATQQESMESRLRRAHLGQFFVLMGDQIDVTGILTLLELKFYGRDKSAKVHVSPQGDKLREFPWFTLGDGRVITELPSGEGKRLRWFIGEDVTDKADTAVAEYMSGPVGGSPGPAMRYAQSNQSADVQFEIPGISGEWRCADIVWADTKSSGDNFLGNGARMAMVLSRQTDGDELLLFCDLRSGSGSDTLWRLRQFNPQVEIEDM